MLTMNKLREGEIAVVEKLMPELQLRVRLQDLGLIEGTAVECVRRSPFGDPTAFKIRGAVIALRESDSSQVLVRRYPRGDGEDGDR